MKSLLAIRREIVVQLQVMGRSKATIERLLAESRAHLGADPDAAVDDGDERLYLAFVYAACLETGLLALLSLIRDLELAENATEATAQALVERLRQE